MHTTDMYQYGHQFFINALEGIDEAHRNDVGVCGKWSVHDLVAHLASYEGGFAEILEGILGIEAPRPFLDVMLTKGPREFNDSEVNKRHDKSYAEVLEEYQTRYARAFDLLSQVPDELLRKDGLIEWYGAEYDLEDFMVYTYYAHKREHGGQINTFKDNLKISKK